MKKINTNQRSIEGTMDVIVTVPTLQDGQKLSSGGIRKDGKLVSQYKNPRPLPQTTQPSFGEQFALELGREVVDICAPILLDAAGHMIVNHVEPFLMKKMHDIAEWFFEPYEPQVKRVIVIREYKRSGAAETTVMKDAQSVVESPYGSDADQPALETEKADSESTATAAQVIDFPKTMVV